MADMLVKLYQLPAIEPYLERLEGGQITLRRAMAYEMRTVTDWVGKAFGRGWSDECRTAFCFQPIRCFIALSDRKRIVGFACHDVTARNFFGPFGVDPRYRRQGIGRALLLSTLQAMKALGYAYGIIAMTREAGFFTRTAGAVPIEGSTPGYYPPFLDGNQL